MCFIIRDNVDIMNRPTTRGISSHKVGPYWSSVMFYRSAPSCPEGGTDRNSKA